MPTPVDFNALIDSILGPLPPANSRTTSNELSNADMDEAYANIITDVSLYFQSTRRLDSFTASLKDYSHIEKNHQRIDLVASLLVVQSHLIKSYPLNTMYSSMTFGQFSLQTECCAQPRCFFWARYVSWGSQFPAPLKLTQIQQYFSICSNLLLIATHISQQDDLAY